mmetsp:Transcript_28910/g.66375  ORF Transcript_28910/g.66375 Transcript_28910/m.66375 type:complete len:359 (+) Transcript_28910:255-1331(+)
MLRDKSSSWRASPSSRRWRTLALAAALALGAAGSGDGECGLPRPELLALRSARLRDDPASGMRELERRLVWEDGPTARLRVDTSGAPGPRPVPNASLAAVWLDQLYAPHPVLVHAKPAVLARLGLDEGVAASEAFSQVFGGCAIPSGVVPFAHAYSGHQFGHWAGQLGDGRALSLGVVAGQGVSAAGLSLEIALKGAGTTPFSRRGDGRAALGNLVRELVADTALVALGVPCVRSLALVASFEPKDAIWRDRWYTGRAERVAPGMLVRVAPSFLRFGSLQLAARTQGPLGVELVVREALHAIATVETVTDESASSLDLVDVPYELQENCFFVRRRSLSCAASFNPGGSPPPLPRWIST